MKTVIEMARDAGCEPMQIMDITPIVYPSLAALERFAYLIRSNEREACAKVCEPTQEHRKEARYYLGGEEGIKLLEDVATAIRSMK